MDFEQLQEKLTKLVENEKEEKAYSVNFRATVTLSGEIQVNASNEDEAKSLVHQIVQEDLGDEDCLIELNSDKGIITVQEIIPSESFVVYNPTALN